MASEHERPRVLIADDHPPQRAGVRAALEDDGFVVVAEVGDAKSAIEEAVRERPDVCVLDIHMPGGGIHAAERITSKVPETVVVMLTVSREDDDLFEALRAGASGYLLKDTDPDRLPIALRGVLSGEAALPRSLVARVVEEFSGRGRRRVSLKRSRGVNLTAREWQVLEQMRDGKTTAEIAEGMFVSPVTVRTHVSAILKKLRVTSRQEAIELFEQE